MNVSDNQFLDKLPVKHSKATVINIFQNIHIRNMKSICVVFFLAKHFHSTNFMDSTNLLQYKILVKSRSSYDYDVIQVQVFVTEGGTIFNCSRSYQPSIH